MLMLLVEWVYVIGASLVGCVLCLFLCVHLF